RVVGAVPLEAQVVERDVPEARDVGHAPGVKRRRGRRADLLHEPRDAAVLKVVRSRPPADLARLDAHRAGLNRAKPPRARRVAARPARSTRVASRAAVRRRRAARTALPASAPLGWMAP